jgi:DeoR family transcriptional regulator of aga operon
MPVTTKQRRERLLALVRAQDFARINELSERLGVSVVTIRNDLDQLAIEGQIRRVRGGAVPRVRPYMERPYEAREDAQAAEKRLIARAAAGLLSSGDSVILDVGTTPMAIAHQLVERTDLKDLTVFTSGLNIALALEAAIPRIHVIVTGGTLRPSQHSLVDPLAALVLDRVRVSVAFVGCNAVHPTRGALTTNLLEAAVKQRMLAASHRGVLVADSTKFSQESLIQVCELSELDLVITSGVIDEAVLAAVREKVEVLVAEPSGDDVAELKSLEAHQAG